eukprot:Awhi_evm1s14003
MQTISSFPSLVETGAGPTAQNVKSSDPSTEHEQNVFTVGKTSAFSSASLRPQTHNAFSLHSSPSSSEIYFEDVFDILVLSYEQESNWDILNTVLMGFRFMLRNNRLFKCHSNQLI